MNKYFYRSIKIEPTYSQSERRLNLLEGTLKIMVLNKNEYIDLDLFCKQTNSNFVTVISNYIGYCGMFKTNEHHSKELNTLLWS